MEDTDQARSSIAYERDILDGLHGSASAGTRAPRSRARPRGPYAPYRQMQRLPSTPRRPNDSCARTWPIRATAPPRSSTPTGRRRRRPGSRRATSAVARPRPAGARAPRGGGSGAVDPVPGRHGVVAFDDIVRGHIEIDVATSAVTSSSSARRHAPLPLRGRRRRRGDADQPRDPWRGPPLQHAQAHPAVPGARLPRPGVRPPAAHPQSRPDEDEQAQGQTAVDDYIEEGFVREAFVNYLALLGWSTGTKEEVLSLDEIVERFDLATVHKGGAVFDRERLEWLNGQWIRRLDPDDLIDRLRPFVSRELEAARRINAGYPPMVNSARCCRSSRSGCRSSVSSATSSASCGWTISQVDPALLVPKRWDEATTRDGLTAARRGGRRDRRGDVRGRRARAAAPGARRDPRLEGGRPVHGDPGRGHRPDGDPAPVRYARGVGRERTLQRLDRAIACSRRGACPDDPQRCPGLAGPLRRRLVQATTRSRSAGSLPRRPSTATTRGRAPEGT